MKQPADAEFLTNQNPEAGQSDKTSYSADEYKNLQAFSTKANQEKIDLAIKLAKKDPKEILEIGDVKLQNKVIKELYNYDNIDELKIMLPQVFEDNSSDDSDDDDRFERLEREQKLLKYKLDKEALDTELEKFSISNKSLVDSIPNFADKVKEELKFISTELSLADRVKRATKLVTNSGDATVEAYLSLQGKITPKAPQN
jgi:hypothetical protein